jgi:hypothetical protein
MKEEQIQNTSHIQSINWFVKGLVGTTTDCVVASIIKERSSIFDLHGSSLPPECFRSKLCGNCVHAFDDDDDCLESFVCKKHLEFYEDYYTAMVRVRNIERYGEKSTENWELPLGEFKSDHPH